MLIKLKWTDDIQEHEEVVILASENDDIFFKDDNQTPSGIKVGDLINTSSRVFFEDDTGIFSLAPDQIISIEPVPE